jgi:hypothetical protein
MVQYHEVKINIDFETAANMIAPGGNVTHINGDIGDASLWVDYIFLDTDERQQRRRSRATSKRFKVASPR